MADDKKDGKSKPWSDKKKFQVALAGFSIIAIIAGGASCNHTTDQMTAARYGQMPTVLPVAISTNIVITKSPSVTFELPMAYGLPTHEIGADVIRDDVAFVAEYNDGPGRGGWIDHMPQRRMSSQAVYHRGNIKRVRYWIEPASPVSEAQLAVVILPLVKPRFHN